MVAWSKPERHKLEALLLCRDRAATEGRPYNCRLRRSNKPGSRQTNCRGGPLWPPLRAQVFEEMGAMSVLKTYTSAAALEQESVPPHALQHRNSLAPSDFTKAASEM